MPSQNAEQVRPGERVVLVAGFTRSFSLTSLNEYLYGKWFDDSTNLSLFRSITTRRIRYFHHFYDVTVTQQTARVCLNAFHQERHDEGTALGLVWHRTVTPIEFPNGDLSRKGFLEGNRTPEVDAWLHDSFGWSEYNAGPRTG